MCVFDRHACGQSQLARIGVYRNTHQTGERPVGSDQVSYFSYVACACVAYTYHSVTSLFDYKDEDDGRRGS